MFANIFQGRREKIIYNYFFIYIPVNKQHCLGFCGSLGKATVGKIELVEFDLPPSGYTSLSSCNFHRILTP